LVTVDAIFCPEVSSQVEGICNTYNYMNPTQELLLLLQEKSKLIGTTYQAPSYHAIQNIIRCIDSILPFKIASKADSKKELIDFKELISFGWPLLLKPYYFDIDINTHLPFPIMTEELFDWTISNLLYAGKIELCNQIISYEKANFIKIKKIATDHFSFSYSNIHHGIEEYDRNSADFYREKIITKIIDDRRKTKPFDGERIKTEFEKLILNPLGQLISYNTTPEIDDYYNEEGHYQLLMMQGYDDFDNKDVFGNIEYWKYLTIIELIIGVGIKHSEACFLLKAKNPNVKLENLLTYTQSKTKAIDDYASYLNWSYSEVDQIFETITLTKENYNYYLEYPATPPPIFIEVGGDLLIRSIAGCFSNPFSLLCRELKRKYRKDYDKAVNNREERFRNELFVLFPQLRIVKIRKEIRISFKDIRTDIDAILFDTHTGTLGLFQLKWQDPYANSMKERYSRISNLFPKANEWISKIKYWIKSNDERTILNALQIDRELNHKFGKINEVCLFVLSRNQMNFTGVEMDESVAWSSWYQLIESQASVKTMFDDPIREMFVKIKSFQPNFRAQREPKEKLNDFKIEFDSFKLTYQKDTLSDSEEL